jgi:serine/threonine protein kinase
VKPGNVLIAKGSGREHCYLADFGLTKQTSSISGLTRTGELVGTVNYVSREQIRGEQVDERSDVYAVGCVLYECLAGDPPFACETEVARLWAHVHEPPPPLAAARPELGEEIEAAAGPPNHANRLEATFAETNISATNRTADLGIFQLINTGTGTVDGFGDATVTVSLTRTTLDVRRLKMTPGAHVRGATALLVIPWA